MKEGSSGGRTAARTGRPPRGGGARAAGATAPTGATLALLAAVVVGAAWAQTSTRLLLERSDSTIEIVNEGRADQGARSILDLAGCVPGESVRSNLFYAPEGGVVARITGEDRERTVVEAPLMIVLRPESDGDAPRDGNDRHDDGGGDGGADGSDGDGAAEETLEALDATATFARPPCLDEVETADAPEVVLRQGRSTATGTRFFLDQGVDVAELDGPVTLVRTPDGDGPPVKVDAASLRFDLGAGRSTLAGDVAVTAGERRSEADELELDEEAGVAILTGDPAVSREGGDEVRGSRLIYDLETNDVVVEGAVSGSFEIEEDAAP